MKNIFFRSLLAVLISQMIAGPLLAQNLTGLADPNSASGLSFRKTDVPTMKGPSEQEIQPQDMINKGMVITDPSLVGVTYQVHVLGEVNDPGTYKITASDRLSEVLKRAGDIKENGSRRNIEVRRKGEATRKVDLLRFQLFGDLSDNPYLLDNDVIFIPLVKDVVQVVGAVKRPMEYEVRNERTLADVIELAGGPSVGVSTTSPIRVVRFVNNEKEVIEVPFGEMKQFDIKNGDTIFVPHKITEKNDFDYDVPKLPGDNIFYPSFEDRVFVLGGVQKPGTYNFSPYYSLPQYLSLAGGTTTMSTGKITVLSSDGRSSRVKPKDINTVVINPGDTIIVGIRRIPPEGWVTLFMSIATFGLSTTATVLALTKK